MQSSRQSMSRLKSGTGVARVRENPIARKYARSPASYQRFTRAMPTMLIRQCLERRLDR